MSSYIVTPNYNFCKAIENFLPGYHSVAKIYAGYKYVCEATIVMLFLMIFFLKYSIKLGLDLSFGRLPNTSTETLDRLSWALAIFSAIGLGHLAIILLNPITGLVLFIIFLIIFFRFAIKR